MKPGDIVTLVDGRRGKFIELDRDGDLIVILDGTTSRRCFRPDFKHYNGELPDIFSIHTPGTTTMSTPYDAEIARAEKALADLKAKAQSEAAKQPTLRWYTFQEFIDFSNTLPRTPICRKIGSTEQPNTFSPTAGDSIRFTCPGPDVTKLNFNQYEYSNDGGRSWNKFGVLA